jgi:phytoene dehydrogenase-like protein
MLMTSLLNGDIPFTDKLRLLRLRQVLASRDVDDFFTGTDSSIHQYLDERGFSRAFVENFVEPFYGGITLDRALGSSAAVFEYTFRMLTEGDIAVPATGMGAIPAQLAKQARAAGVRIETETHVDSITLDNPTVSTGTETHTPQAVVIATDPSEATRLTGIKTPLNSRGCITQHFGAARHRKLDTERRIMLNTENTGPNTIAPMSTVSPEYAPEDRQLFAATFVGRTDDHGQSESELFEHSNEELAEQVRSALRSWYSEHRFDELELLHTDRVPFSQFVQPPGFYTDLPAADSPSGPVSLAGDYTRWSSIQGALASGKDAAMVAADYVTD